MYGGDSHKAKKIAHEFVISCGNAPEVLEFAE